MNITPTVSSGQKMGSVLTATDGTLKASLTLFGQYAATGFHLAKDGAGTAVAYAVPTSAHSSDLAEIISRNFGRHEL